MTSRSVSIRKSDHLIETMRRPISYAFGVFVMFMALFTVPRGFATHWHEAAEMTGFVLLIIAALGRIWSLVYIAGRKSRELCQHGPYSLTRNPLYLFSFIGVIGFALALQNVILALVAALVFLVYYNAVIRSEERRLREIHGEDFEDFCARVPRFWPRVAAPDPGDGKVQLNTGPFLRGIREVFWFLAAIILADVLEWAHVQKLWSTLSLPF